MSLNWKEIDAVLEEIPFAGSFIQKIQQPDFSSLILDLYWKEGRYSLYISLAPGQTRLHTLSRKVENTVQLQRFAQLLRSRLKGARIVEAEQVGSDRIVRLLIRRADVSTLLWLRLWSNAANIIFTESDGTIIDAFYRRPKRGEITGGVFPPNADGRIGRRNEKEYKIRDFPGDGTLSERIEDYYFAARDETTAEVLRERIERILLREDSRLETAVQAARLRLASGDEIEQNRRTGDILMSNLHRIDPGARWIDLENFFEDNEPISIELDPGLSPDKNAERYYKKARKQKRRLVLARQDLESLESKRSAVGEKLASLGDEMDIRTLQDILTSLESEKSRGAAGDGASTPGLRFQSGPFTLLLGRTSKENDELLRHHVRGNDYWLHTRDFPGAYVFVKSIKGKSIPLEVLLDAGALALHYSKAKTGGQGDLFYTQVKYLRRAKGGKQGLVIPTQEKNLTVRLEQERIERLLKKTGPTPAG